MSVSSQSNRSTTSPTGVVDPLDLLDFTEYDGLSYQSPSLSPAATNKPQFARPTTTMTATPSTMPPSQTLSGPSHQYDQYKQQTPFVPGALASTLAVNESNAHITGYSMDYMSSNEEMFDFNSAPSQHSMNTPDMDVDFESQSDPSFYYAGPSTINPHAVDNRDAQLPSPTVPSQTSSVGRMYPGMHQQAALAKAQQQQRQQQQIIQQQQHQRQSQQGKHHRPKAPLPSDPLVEQKITQLLNTMRAKANMGDGVDNSPLMQIHRPKKEEDDMDEDERLLASEEGKKLSSKERRQLRNKVSARAFRSRRKEYITQLEAEIATKVTENGELRGQNRALAEENRRLSDLTRMLLSSPSFSNFLDHLSSSPAAVPQAQPQVEQRQPERQIPKDVNPYNNSQQGQQHQQIGMVMMPEQTMDFSMLNLNTDAFNYQPQVFSVLETPEMPVIDMEALAGKNSIIPGESLALDNEKTDAPVVEDPVSHSLEKSQAPELSVEPTAVEKAVAKLDGDIFDDDTPASTLIPAELNTESLSTVDIFGGIEPEKAFARYEIVDASEGEAIASIALRRVERLAASLEATMARLELLSIDL
ncbi:Uu.00g077000.m01.CDS01 [Anthostomella pinea]|uniref:Uu.00g077000.m01.CDS01 n=1 Tax=Anthostomella pinea TaxID=933095 RepID=A0AAI8VWV6_9PEZI|nr:Uu.00g077000.m01.CDS01 [Anthostomella pinea]